MPWTAKDAERHTHKASTPAAQRQWSAIANKVLADTGSDAKAIRIANGQVAAHKSNLKDKRNG